MNFNAQMRFAKQLAKTKKVTAKQLPLQRQMDVSLSSEMAEWLQTTLETDNTSNELGLPQLNDDVSSVLLQPLDSMAVYCPVGAVMTNKLAAARSNAPSTKGPPFSVSSFGSPGGDDGHNHHPMPGMSPNQLLENSLLASDASYGFNRADNEIGGASLHSAQQGSEGLPGSLSASMGHSSMLSTWAQNKAPAMPTPPIPIDNVVSRLQVMWLQRRAQFEREEGDLDTAMDTLNDALALHLGTSDYAKADLSRAVHSDPAELLDYIADTYAPFDKSAHFEAGRIQRCFRRHVRYRSMMATRIQAFYRMFLVRLDKWQGEETRKQCVQLIQRAYRRRLVRMRAASTRIKRWYKTQKQMDEYRQRLFVYRMARRIQRLWRGNKNREISWQRRSEKYGNLLIQRQTRAYNSRRKRTLAIKLYHRMFFNAARTIQKRVRCLQAVRRSQLQLLLELAKEEDRHARERQVVEETIKVQITKTKLYMSTDAGRHHLQVAMNRIRLQDKAFHKTRHTRSKQELMGHEALVTFEMFDGDGSGQIDADELKGMLRELSIPLNDEEFGALMTEIDADGSGEIDFGEFLQWYTGGGGEEAAQDASMAQKAFKVVLQAQHAIMELSGVILRKRGERSILRQATAWLTKDIVSTFRNTHPPKFQCCQCLSPFVLFTDYLSHFDADCKCSVVGQKALFYPKFFVKQDWKNQRQCEHELMRVNDEVPNINYHAYMAAMSDLSMQSDPGVNEALSRQIRAAQILYVEKANLNGEKIDMRQEMLDSINVCKDNFIAPLTAMMVGKRLGRSIPTAWVTEDRWDYGEFTEWFTKVVDEDVAKRKPLLTFGTRGKLRVDCAVVADVHVRTIRLLQVTTEASLFGLLDSRSRRPRKITVSDDELDRMGLSFLTEREFLSARNTVVERLRVLNREMHKILTIRVPKRCAPKKKMNDLIGDPQVGPDGLLPLDALREILIQEAHVVAEARFGSRVRSPVGRVQLTRLSHELWARHMLLRDQFPRRLSAARKEAELRFFYERFASAETGDGIDFHDFDLVQRSLSLRIKAALWDTVKAALDPLNTGFISFESILQFIATGASKAHYSFLRGFGNALKKAGHVARARLYIAYAREFLVSKMRKISRLELEYRTTSLRAQLMAAEIEPAALATHRTRQQRAADEAARVEQEAKAAEKKAQDALKPWIYVAPDKPTRMTLPLLPQEVEAERQRLELERKGEELSIPVQIALAEMDQTSTEANQVLEKLNTIKTADETTENLLLYRLAENEAEAKVWRQLFSRQGLSSLAVERLVMDATDSFIEAYGFLVPPGAKYPWTAGPGKYEPGWDLALSVLIYTFDTDCSGTFDEGEVRLLLRAAFCGLPDKKVLYNFSDLLPNGKGSATLEDVVKYLAPRVGWRRGKLHRFGRSGSVFVSKVSGWQASAMLLVSLSRQLAREKAEQATALARTGDLLEGDDAKNDDALLMRSQLFAMRQVTLFLRTSQGRIQFLLAKRRVKHWYREDCWKPGWTRQGLLRYAFLLHADRGAAGEMLITELPHMLRYLVVVCGFQVASGDGGEVGKLAEMMSKVKTKADVRWVGRDEAIALMDGILQKLSSADSLSRVTRATLGARIASSRSAARDTKTHMSARARQQAVLVSLGFEGIYVAETNYRCSVLGLHALLLENKRTGWKGDPRAMNWLHVPKEATPYLLLSSGYTLDDLYIGDMPSLAELDHRQGGLALEKVDVKMCLRVAREQSEPVHSILQGAYRWARWMTGLPRYLEYRRYAKVLTQQRKQLEEAGAVFLREILKGQSHAVSVEDGDD